MEKTNPIDEARRYVANAEEIIKKANLDPELKIYTDSKYIKIAGDILWKGCLIALNAVLDIRKGKGRPSIEKYKEAAGKRDRKLLLTARELRKLKTKVQEKGLTIIPVVLFINEKGLAKLDIALARGKHYYDKRETLKTKDSRRDVEKQLKGF